MIVIKYPLITKLTAERIAEYIKENGYDDVKVERCLRYSSAEMCVNWGCNSIRGEYDIVLNPPEKVRENSNKIPTLKALRDAGYPVGRFVTSDDEYTVYPDKVVVDDMEIKIPLIFRPPKHRKGRDFIVVLDGRELDYLFEKYSGGYAREYYIKDSEYRVHVVGYEDDYKAIGIMRKDPENPIKYSIRNHKYGWVFHTVRRNERTQTLNTIMKTVKMAVREIGLNIASVDIATVGDEWFILEVNSGSGVSSNIIAPRYARRIINIYDTIIGE